jgi:hypothetical protein
MHIPSYTASHPRKKAFFSKYLFSAALTKRLAVRGLVLLISAVLGLPKTALEFSVL